MKQSVGSRHKPIWIVVTGLDGSGKTNLVTNLADYYRSKGLNVATAHLPYDPYLRKELLPQLKDDSYADRMLFAIDNRRFAIAYRELSEKYDVVVTQRGFLDSFVHGSVQGYSYSFIAELNRIEELPVCDVMIHLVASADVAYKRIKDDPEADKFEYPKYIRKQEAETRKAFYALQNGDPDLAAFSTCDNVLIDTTYLTIRQTFVEAKKFLKSKGLN